MHEELTATNNCWWYKISQPNNLLRPLLYKSPFRILQSPQIHDLPFNANTYLVEYEIGLVLSKTYKLKQLNHLPHRDNLSPYYEQSIRILTKYKITLEELQTGKIKPIYIQTIIPYRLQLVRSR